MTKPAIINRVTKGLALTYDELDTNFKNLQDSTITVTGDSGTITNNLNDSFKISGGTGLTSSVSGTTLTLNLDNTAVTAGSYTNANITVDAQGRITTVASGSSSSYTLPTATTTVLGGVKIDGTTVTIASGVISAAAAAGTLSGTTLKSTVVNSSLTSVGTLTSLAVSGAATVGSVVTQAISPTNTLVQVATNVTASSRLDLANGTTASGSTKIVELGTNGASGSTTNISIGSSAGTSITTLNGVNQMNAIGNSSSLGEATLKIGGFNSSQSGGLYHDFLRVVHEYSGATNPSKTFRLSSTGSLEIVNSAFTSTLFSLADSGNLTLSGSLTMANRPAFRVYGTGASTAATTTMTSSKWTVDYNQGSYLNGTTGIFTAPIAGLYQVDVVCRTAANNNNTINQIVIYKNTSTAVIMLEWAVNTTVNHIGGSSMIKLAANDTLKFVVTVGTISFDGNDNWSVAYIG